MSWKDAKPILPGPDQLITREHFNNLADLTVNVRADTEKIDKTLADMMARLEELQRKEPDADMKQSMVAVTTALGAALAQSKKRFSRRSLLGLKEKDEK